MASLSDTTCARDSRSTWILQYANAPPSGDESFPDLLYATCRPRVSIVLCIRLRILFLLREDRVSALYIRRAILVVNHTDFAMEARRGLRPLRASPGGGAGGGEPPPAPP